MEDMELTPVFYHEGSEGAMTNEELVALIQRGERDRLPELWAQVERFVWQRAKRWGTAMQGLGGVVEDDLHQVGYIAMLEAVESYREDKGKSFVGWFDYYLKTAFAEVYGLRTTRLQHDPLRAAIRFEATIEGLEGITVGDSIPDPTAEDEIAAIAEQDRKQRLYAALKKTVAALPQTEREVLQARYYQGRTLQEIATERGLSHERVRQIEGRALRRLRHPAFNRELRRQL